MGLKITCKFQLYLSYISDIFQLYLEEPLTTLLLLLGIYEQIFEKGGQQMADL